MDDLDLWETLFILVVVISIICAGFAVLGWFAEKLEEWMDRGRG